MFLTEGGKVLNQYKTSEKSIQNLKKYKWFINSSMPAAFVGETAKVKNAKEMRELFIQGYVERYSNQWQDPITKQTKNWRKIFKDLFKNPDESTDWTLTIFIEILFGDLTSGSIITWNRHKVSHGEISRYGRLENTIRCFMILDFLSELS